MRSFKIGIFSLGSSFFICTGSYLYGNSAQKHSTHNEYLVEWKKDLLRVCVCGYVCKLSMQIL